MRKSILLIIALALVTGTVYAASALDEAFKIYKGDENLTFSAERGKEMWNKKVVAKDGKMRDCNACHGKDFTKPGKHVRTGKAIDPMSPTVNKERFTELRKIKKWFKRNCKWMYGRECTNQEKGDFLMYLSQQ
ncbi:MAG: DUF1924 domain-containing protein [Gammaproteobacteria bacterium]|jgi:hypothetical protein